MSLDLGRILGSAFSITWRHKWLWLLGVFGGGSVGFRANVPTGSGGGGNGTPSGAQVQQFLAEWWWLIAVVAGALLLIAIATFVISCIAVPAATWAALALDAGEPATLGAAWRQGRRRGWVYFRLALLKLAMGVALVAVLGVLLLVGLLIFAGAGSGSLLVLIPVGIVLLIALVAVGLALAFLLAWSDRTPVLLGAGAVEAIRMSVRLARRRWVDTLIFAIVLGLVAGILGVGVVLAGAVLAIPGGIVAFAGLGASSSLLIGIGIVLAVVLGGAALVVGGGFVGALVQVAYALACRDLCLSIGLEVDPEIPLPVTAPSQLSPLPPALA